MNHRKTWAESRDRLVLAVTSLGFPADFGVMIAKYLGSPKAIDRMTAYLYKAKPASVEMIVDEMLAICADIDAWREKKKSLEAQAGYSAWLNSETRIPDKEDP